MPDKEECEIIIMFGSETGTSYDFGMQLFHALSAVDKKVFLTELNQYTTFPKAEHIIILTSTYGEGESPQMQENFLAAWNRYTNQIT